MGEIQDLTGQKFGRLKVLNFNAGYSPDNCRWATRTQQNRNTRRNRRITFNGETLTAAEWAQRFGISYSLLSNRLKRGWSIERALTTEKQEHRRGALV